MDKPESQLGYDRDRPRCQVMPKIFFKKNFRHRDHRSAKPATIG